MPLHDKVFINGHVRNAIQACGTLSAFFFQSCHQQQQNFLTIQGPDILQRLSHHQNDHLIIIREVSMLWYKGGKPKYQKINSYYIFMGGLRILRLKSNKPLID